MDTIFWSSSLYRPTADIGAMLIAIWLLSNAVVVQPAALKDSNASHLCSNLTIGLSDSCDHDLLATIYPKPARGSLFSAKKMWFARRLNDGIFLAGQVTPRQIKYAADSGFKSVLSIFDHDGKKGPDGQVIEISTAEEQHLVENVSGMKFFKVLHRNDDWFSVKAVERMHSVYPHVEFPALFHCGHGVSVTLITLLYYVNQTLHDFSFKPRVDIQRLYEVTRRHGLDFVEFFNLTVKTVETITGEKMPDTAMKPNVSMPAWFEYWQSYPIYHNWFSAGQINSNDLHLIKTTGFVTIINLRAGLTTKGRPSQESVELINIRSSTPTYGTSSQPSRQSKEGLHRSIIDTSRSTQYISDVSSVNYESRNPHEFGDDIGHNEDIERAAVTEAGIGYAHLPLTDMSDFAGYMETYLDQLIEIGKSGPVLLHCASGKRAAYVAVLVAALQYDLSFEWSLQRLKEMGFGISAEKPSHIYEVYKDYLITKKRNVDDPGNGGPRSTAVVSPFLFSCCLSFCSVYVLILLVGSCGVCVPIIFKNF